MVYNCVARDLVPWIIISPFWQMCSDAASNLAIHLRLYRTPMKRSAPAGKYGKIVSCMAEAERKGRRRSHVCDNVTVSPFSMQNMIKVVATLRLMCGVVMEM